MTEKELCLSSEELKLACAKLKAATDFGFIAEESLEAMEIRRKEHNQKIKKELEEGKIIYGMTHFSPPAYLQYELTRFRLDFVSQKAQNYQYACITEQEKKAFFRENRELFQRCEGDYFLFEDVDAVIEKRIREEEYYRYVQNLLCQC
ncbi:MAG: hypothetical protein ACI4DN_00765 [Lachnospiraceae bacterium]